MTNPFYKSKRWEQKRKRVLRRDGYLCQESKRYGKSEPATTVHHIYQREFYPELELVDWNLLSLSNKMHNAMHIRDSHELTELGKQWQERRREQFEGWMKENGLDRVETRILERITFVDGFRFVESRRI